MISDHSALTEAPPRRRTTAPLTWLVIIGVALLLLLLRLPAITAMAGELVVEAARELGDESMASTAVTFGTVGAIGLQLLLMMLMAAIATVLERFLGPEALGKRLRIGVAGVVYVVLVIGQHLWAVATGVVAIERSWALWLIAIIVSVAAPALFRSARESARVYALAAAAALITGGLLCLG